MDNDHLCPNLTSCFSKPAKGNFTDLAGVLGLLEQADRKLEEEAKTSLEKEKVDLMRAKVKEAREEVAKELGPNQNHERLIQKVRICGQNETAIRIVTWSSLISLLILSALATYQLHKITDYKVRLLQMFV